MDYRYGFHTPAQYPFVDVTTNDGEQLEFYVSDSGFPASWCLVDGDVVAPAWIAELCGWDPEVTEWLVEVHLDYIERQLVELTDDLGPDDEEPMGLGDILAMLDQEVAPLLSGLRSRDLSQRWHRTWAALGERRQHLHEVAESYLVTEVEA